MIHLSNQKYLIILILFSVNIILSSTFIIYEHMWYVFIGILALASTLYSFSSILLLGNKICNKNDNNYDIKRLLTPKNYLYVIPCYNETEQELMNTLISIVYQRNVPDDKKSIVIICDGQVKGKGNNYSTDIILLKMLKNKNQPIIYQYTTREDTINELYIYDGLFNNINYILIIKKENSGKRDSLVLIRKICYNYNNKINQYMKYFTYKLNKIYNEEQIEYIIGTDADTVLEYNCSYELIKTLDKDKDIYGCVGYVDINKNMNFLNPYVLYQYAEYMFSQCLKRQAQSNLTHKVNCLSGCNQILRISKETCGEEILSLFNYCPTNNDSIFTHIRSIASEDRNHICLMLSLYPYVKTVQNLNAIAYTTVPTNLNIFLSQRRRWTLGASTNDMLLLKLPNINIFEKISSFVNIFIFCLSPFILTATIMFIRSLIKKSSMLMLYLSILMLIPFSYGLFIPLFVKQMTLRDALFFYISYIFFLCIGSIINILIYMYSFLTMDTIKWGKQREIESEIENIYIYDEIETMRESIV